MGEASTQAVAFPTTVLVAVILLLHPARTTQQEVENEREFSYQPGSDVGPSHWGHIHEDWKACEKGHMQSPIDVSDQALVTRQDLGIVRRKYRPAAAIMVNRGHDIMLKWNESAAKDGPGGILLNGTEYMLKQLHWHSPSEHSIDGKRFDLELHMVHVSADKKPAVIGIMYKIGRPDPFLAELEEYIRKLRNIKEGEEEVGVVDPRDVRKGSRKYYRYIGSLTTPPCTEGVVWTIIKKVRTASHDQIKLLRDAVNDEAENNSRPVQPMYHRFVQLYRPKTP